MILILGGTREGRKITEKLATEKMPVIASVTSDYGARLLADYDVEINKGKFNKKQLKTFVRENDIKIIIDATHPFARSISENAIKVSKEKKVKYIRYEREKIEINSKFKKTVIKVSDYKQAARQAGKYEKVLLTTGSNNIQYFTEEIENWQQKLIIRILPHYKYLQKLQKTGFSPGNIVAVQGPFSKKFNQIIIEDYDIKVIVTKASGPAGGLDTKLEAACSERIPVILIERPNLNYQTKVNNVKELLSFLGKYNKI